MTLAINFKDPRYQKAVLKAGAYANANTQGLVSDITSRFVGQQMDFKMGMRRVAQSERHHQDRIDFSRKVLKDKRKMFRKEMNIAQKQSDFATIFGLGTGLYSAIEGNRRRRETDKLTAENRAWRRRMEQRSLDNEARFAALLEKGTV